MKLLSVHGLYSMMNPELNSNLVSGLIKLTLVLKYSYLVCSIIKNHIVIIFKSDMSKLTLRCINCVFIFDDIL